MQQLKFGGNIIMKVVFAIVFIALLPSSDKNQQAGL